MENLKKPPLFLASAVDRARQDVDAALSRAAELSADVQSLAKVHDLNDTYGAIIIALERLETLEAYIGTIIDNLED